MDIRYLNTDLEIESAHDLSLIVEEFGEDVLVHHHGEINGYQHASCSSGSAGMYAEADGTINDLCSLIENLSPAARKVWDGCCTRRFDIGYESGTAPRSFSSEVRAATVQRVAALGGSLVVTIYPVRDSD
jgi:hypothetical protein